MTSTRTGSRSFTFEITPHLSPLSSIRNRVLAPHAQVHPVPRVRELPYRAGCGRTGSAPAPGARRTLPAVIAPLCAGRGAARALTEAKGRPAARLL